MAAVTLEASPEIPSRAQDHILHRINAQGKFVRIVREQYKHDTLQCHHSACESCPTSAISLENKETFVLPDFEVLVDFLDVFESEKVTDVLLAETVLLEVSSLATNNSWGAQSSGSTNVLGCFPRTSDRDWWSS